MVSTGNAYIDKLASIVINWFAPNLISCCEFGVCCNNQRVSLPCIQVFLGAVNLYYFIILISVVSSVESPWKRPAGKLHHLIQSKLLSPFWISKTFINVSLFTINSHSYGSGWNRTTAVAAGTLVVSFVLYKVSERPLSIHEWEVLLEREHALDRQRMLLGNHPPKLLFEQD